MADFHQHPKLPTLHHLASAQDGVADVNLVNWAKEKPVALLLPALFIECERPAFPQILEEVSQVEYVGQVVVTMNQMRGAECEVAIEFLKRHLRGKPACLLWNDGGKWRLWDALLTWRGRGQTYGWDWRGWRQVGMRVWWSVTIRTF
jgi:glucosyl-3-phosphoglycerate synthase